LVGEFGEPVSMGFHKEISNSRITTVKMKEQEPGLDWRWEVIQALEIES
jgi:hypothetical protein